MTTFWILAALLTALALAHVLPVLLRPRPATNLASAVERRTSTLAILREQAHQLDAELAAGNLTAEQHRQARDDIERRVLEEADDVGPAGASAAASLAAADRPWKSAWLLGLGVPLLVATVYSRVGAPQAIVPPPAPAMASLGADNVSDAQVEDLVSKLAAAMEEKPDDLAGWKLLARTYAVLQRYPEANKAYTRATALAPNDAQLLADHADVLAMLQGQKISGEPAALVTRALQLDPKNLKALALAGGAAYEAGQYPQAIEYWTVARQLSPPDTPFSDNLERSLVDARNAMRGNAPGAEGAPDTTANGAAPSSSTAAAHVTGQVSLSPALAGQAAPTDTVFIYARAVEGPRMPLAILRRTVADLPIRFTLDDAMAMSPAMRLSNFPVVVVGARVSKTGNALPAAGDLSGQKSGVKLGTEDLQIVIDTVQP